MQPGISSNTKGGGRGTDSTKRGRYDKRRVDVKFVHMYVGWKEQGDSAV